jgi:erlin
MFYIYLLSLLVFPISAIQLHQCHQGHRCVYYRGGSLLNTITDPGFHIKTPLITSHYNIQVTWQTDRLENLVCGSSQGGEDYLDIEVVNKLTHTDKCILKVVGEHTIDYDKPLIFDYIPSEVAQFCKNYTLDDIVIREFDKLDEVLLGKLRENVESYDLGDCIEIKKVRINRPKLDAKMKEKFESIENEKKATELAEKQKETQKVRLESELQKEMMEKDRQRQTNEIQLQIMIETARKQAERQAIDDEKNLKSKQIDADAVMYSMKKKAEGYSILFDNPDYIRMEALKSAYNNAKIIIGEIPKNSLFGFGGMTSNNPVATNYFNRTFM